MRSRREFGPKANGSRDDIAIASDEFAMQPQSVEGQQAIAAGAAQQAQLIAAEEMEAEQVALAQAQAYMLAEEMAADDE